MDKLKIEDYIYSELLMNDQKVALALIEYLRANEMQFIKDNGYWKDKIYYIVKYKTECVCFIAIKDPDEKDNRWTVWSDDMQSSVLENFKIEQNLKEAAWKHVDTCGNCGSCTGGRHKTIYGKDFNNVCRCTFRIDNPNTEDLMFMKKMVDIRIQEILVLTK
ncbi:MAG: hypothetical protein A2Y17_09520 [Clostridiales bacterium GWF2_38_85]|nr:MAG: hypothetical protein A2Y17_09520 [Clostridiales bacterium GWF2_38_85]HBL83564.1 hypothetical protein [Clostridiales bacterium]